MCTGLGCCPSLCLAVFGACVGLCRDGVGLLGDCADSYLRALKSAFSASLLLGSLSRALS